MALLDFACIFKNGELLQYKEAKELPNVDNWQHITDKLKDYDIYAIVGK